MKRNREKARGMRSGTSPYAKYGKTPVRYSDALRNWERSIGRSEAAQREIEQAKARTP